ncbi:MAG: DUF357 domain-containing protein [Methanobrevibacter sp.]|jgi:hypothetical protein|nr:DUF357 domain-containing protein [Candidatus Methanoflexus mossambicus]
MEEIKEKKRIEVDIDNLKESIEELNNIKLNEKENEILEKIKTYLEDCEYYLKKNDLFTSFGCITYAHGLIDAIKINRSLI